jgi:hypothetical protein
MLKVVVKPLKEVTLLRVQGDPSILSVIKDMLVRKKGDMSTLRVRNDVTLLKGTVAYFYEDGFIRFAQGT